MRTEDALRRILPHISTIDVQYNSGVRLIGSTPAEFILLRKAKKMKSNEQDILNHYNPIVNSYCCRV